jgi:hypothetical protein
MGPGRLLRKKESNNRPTLFQILECPSVCSFCTAVECNEPTTHAHAHAACHAAAAPASPQRGPLTRRSAHKLSGRHLEIHLARLQNLIMRCDFLLHDPYPQTRHVYLVPQIYLPNIQMQRSLF